MINSNIIKLHKCTLLLTKRSLSQRVVEKSGKRWHLLSAVCLQRLPSLSVQYNWLQEKFLTCTRQFEAANSLYSDHEMKHFEDLRRAERVASGNIKDGDLDASAKQTAQDFEDKAIIEKQEFKPALRVTKADETNDRKSLQRCLDQHLMLVTKIKIGDNFKWMLPQERNEEGETMRQTAERALLAAISEEAKVRFMGNAPCTVYTYLYPKVIREKLKADGAKTFFFKAQFLDGNVAINKDIIADYEWLNRNELETGLEKLYWQKLRQSLLLEHGPDLNNIINRSSKLTYIVKKKLAQKQN